MEKESKKEKVSSSYFEDHEMIKSMRIDSGFQENMWVEELLSTSSILNRVPHKKIDVTPYEVWNRGKPLYDYDVVAQLKKMIPPIMRTFDVLKISKASRKHLEKALAQVASHRMWRRGGIRLCLYISRKTNRAKERLSYLWGSKVTSPGESWKYWIRGLI